VIEYPEHLNFFTTHSLDHLLAGAGISKVEMRTTGISPTDIWAGLRGTNEGQFSTGGSADLDRRIRARMTRSHAFERAAQIVNMALSTLGVGDTIKALYQRP